MSKMTIEQAFDAALQHHQAGRLVEAEGIYRGILAQQPRNADVMQLLGVLASQVNAHDQALELLRGAIAIVPDFAEAHGNLGLALKRAGRLDEAIVSYRRAIEIKPDFVDVHNNLGLALQGRGEFDAAIECYQRALALRPDFADAHNNLGDVLQNMERFDEAIESFQRALSLRPDFIDAHNNLGNALQQRGRLDEAIASFQQALSLNPQFIAARNNLGNAFHAQGHVEKAIACFRQVLIQKPDFAQAHNNLGNVLKDMGQIDAAIACYQRALVIDPNYVDARSNLASILHAQGRLDEAVACFEQAIALRPDFVSSHINLGNVFKDQGRLDEAIASYRRALELRLDNAVAHSNLAYALHFYPGYDGNEIFKEHLRWNDRHARHLRTADTFGDIDRSPDRRLRIGYVSPDFREHVVAWNLLPLLSQHDHEKFEVIAYADLVRPDATTDRIRAMTDGWRDIRGKSDEQVAELIRTDRVDILIDLASHMKRNRLLVFAHKPAPVQVTYLAYCSTTGLEAMDYRFSDPYMDPADSDLSYYSERTMRLPQTYWCYRPGGPTPEVSLPPSLANGFVTFGCMNNFAKVSGDALELWADVLSAVHASRLLLSTGVGSHRKAVIDRFAKRGISADRLELIGWQPWEQYVQQLSSIDIALDPFPYNGGITSCDALWMGVPVVSLSGRTAVGRAGGSILSNIGLRDMVADTPEEYVRIAVDFANDQNRLRELRTTLRQRMEQSPLMDAPRFARDVEAAYRQMWRSWCDSIIGS
jgi:protein O-GlcNAc transferase